MHLTERTSSRVLELHAGLPYEVASSYPPGTQEAARASTSSLRCEAQREERETWKLGTLSRDAQALYLHRSPIAADHRSDKHPALLAQNQLRCHIDPQGSSYPASFHAESFTLRTSLSQARSPVSFHWPWPTPNPDTKEPRQQHMSANSRKIPSHFRSADGQPRPNATQPKLILVPGCVAPRCSGWWPA